MHIAAVCTFDGPTPTLEDVADVAASRLHELAHHRQVLRHVPLDLGRPVWVDDADFDLGAHLHRAALPHPGDEAELATLVGDVMSQPLDRRHPLWEVWLVEGLADDGWALLFKVHHCMVDGIAGIGLLAAFLSPDPDAQLEPPVPWTPAPAPSGTALVADAWRAAGVDLLWRGARLPWRLGHPRTALRSAARTGVGLARFGAKLVRPPKRPEVGSVGPHRRWAPASAELEDVRIVRRELGGTVNDVVLAAVAGGYRELLEHRGIDPATATLRTMLPVSLRDARGGGADNELSAVLYDLPVGIADPVLRLATVEGQLAELKRSHEIEAAAATLSVADLAPPPLVHAVTQAIVRAEHVLPQGMVDTVVTNIPGPQFTLYCLGRRMRSAHPFVGLSYGVRIVTAVLSYDGRLWFGVTGDLDSSPDVGILADAAVAGIGDLRRAAERERRRRVAAAVR
jgi:WS/DGAT/MGAT family acyltransferase